MSDEFIPLNQSTPVQGKWRNQNRSFQNNRHNSGPRRSGGYNNRWGGNNSSMHSRNSSFGSDSNSSFGQENKNNIDAYLHPSMLQDPWAQLRQQNMHKDT